MPYSTTGRQGRGVTPVTVGQGPAPSGDPGRGTRPGTGGAGARDAELLQDLADAKARRSAVSDELLKWLCAWGFTAFWSLTFNPSKFHDSPSVDVVRYMWLRVIVENLNRQLYGGHYRRLVGHSYFSYVVGIEPHKSGALHLHAATTGRTDWSMAHRLWQSGVKLRVGTIEIRRIQDTAQDLRYVLKYVGKGGDLLYYKAGPCPEPKFKPLWYLST